MSIEIKESEIANVESMGTLDGEDVKLVTTHGGLRIAVGKLKGKMKDEVLAAGSHPAIVRYNIQKSYSSFQPSLMKSEAGVEPMVAEMSFLLPKDMFDKSFDIYVVKKNLDFEVVLTKNNVEVIKYDATVSGDDVVVQKPNTIITADVVPAISAISKAVALIAIDEDKTGVITGNKRYSAQKIANK